MAQSTHRAKHIASTQAALDVPFSLLGNGLSVIRTATAAILASEKLGAEAETLEIGIKIISDAYTALDTVRCRKAAG